MTMTSNLLNPTSYSWNMKNNANLWWINGEILRQIKNKRCSERTQFKLTSRSLMNDDDFKLIEFNFNTLEIWKLMQIYGELRETLRQIKNKRYSREHNLN